MSEQNLEQLLVANDLAKLNIEQRVAYYNDVCKSLGLNPLTRPFDFVTLNGKLQLYAKKDATDQLRRIYSVSVNSLTHDHKETLGLYIVTAGGVNNKGREDVSTGAVSIKGLVGDNLANAIMKAETKAKRRLTLSLCGLGILDETEIETAAPERIATVVDGHVVIDSETQKSLAERPIPTPEKKTRKKKESVPDAGKPWGGEFEPKNVPKSPEPITNGQTNIHGLDIKDEEIPFPGDPEPKPEPARLATDAERKEFMARLIKLKDAGYTGIREWLLKESGVQITNDIPYEKMKSLVTQLETALEASELKGLLEAK